VDIDDWFDPWCEYHRQTFPDVRWPDEDNPMWKAWKANFESNRVTMDDAYEATEKIAGKVQYMREHLPQLLAQCNTLRQERMHAESRRDAQSFASIAEEQYDANREIEELRRLAADGLPGAIEAVRILDNIVIPRHKARLAAEAENPELRRKWWRQS
jgi:hypothetical protein